MEVLYAALLAFCVVGFTTGNFHEEGKEAAQLQHGEEMKLLSEIKRTLSQLSTRLAKMDDARREVEKKVNSDEVSLRNLGPPSGTEEKEISEDQKTVQRKASRNEIGSKKENDEKISQRNWGPYGQVVDKENGEKISQRNFGPSGQEVDKENGEKISHRNFGPSGQEVDKETDKKMDPLKNELRSLMAILLQRKTQRQSEDRKQRGGERDEERYLYGARENKEYKRNFGLWG